MSEVVGGLVALVGVPLRTNPRFWTPLAVLIVGLAAVILGLIWWIRGEK